MSCSSLCYPECGVAPPSPVSGSCNEPCVRQCPDSKVLIRQSPVVVTLPGPILNTFSQHSEVGAFGAPVIRPAFEGSFGLGRLYGSGSCYGGLYGLGGLGGYWRGYGGLCGYGGGYGYGDYVVMGHMAIGIAVDTVGHVNPNRNINEIKENRPYIFYPFHRYVP